MESAVHVGVLLGAGPPLSSETKTALSQLISGLFEKAKICVNKAHQTGTEEDKDVDAILIDLADKLVSMLEDSEYTNAGRGSELSRKGKVECDATMMLGGSDGQEVFGSVGAVPDLEHPISLCRNIVDLQMKNITESSLSVPNFIVGEGARDYGVGLGLCRGELVTERARETYRRWESRMKEADSLNLDKYMDTVGLILVCRDKVCVCSSSGGSLLKDPGRVGPAALVGKGLDIGEECSAVCSGFGEDINSMRLAQKVVTSCDDELGAVINKLSKSKIKYQRPPPSLGVLRATIASAESVLFEWHHTTQSMLCGFGNVSHSTDANFRVVSSSKPQGGGFKSECH